MLELCHSDQRSLWRALRIGRGTHAGEGLQRERIRQRIHASHDFGKVESDCGGAQSLEGPFIESACPECIRPGSSLAIPRGAHAANHTAHGGKFCQFSSEGIGIWLCQNIGGNRIGGPDLTQGIGDREEATKGIPPLSANAQGAIFRTRVEENRNGQSTAPDGLSHGLLIAKIHRRHQNSIHAVCCKQLGTENGLGEALHASHAGLLRSGAYQLDSDFCRCVENFLTHAGGQGLVKKNTACRQKTDL